MSVYPLGVKVDRNAEKLTIDWSDGFCTEFPLDFLRSNCPSAGERASRNQKESDPLSILSNIPSSEIIDARMVGNYALNLTWADGHSAGIYTWEYLRKLSEDSRVTSTAIA